MSEFLVFCSKLEKVQKTPGRLDKVALLKKMAEDHPTIFYWYFRYAYDPYIIFGISSIPAQEVLDRPLCEWEHVEKLVASVASKSLSRAQIVQEVNRFNILARDWVQAMLSKDLRIGATSATINKIVPGLIPSFEVMCAEVYTKGEPLNFPVAVEPKLDGLRCVAFVDVFKREIRFISRGGKPLYNTQLIEEELWRHIDYGRHSLYKFVLDGEMFAGSFADSLSVTKSSETEPEPELLQKLRFIIFDVIDQEAWNAGKSEIEFWQRRKTLQNVLPQELQRQYTAIVDQDQIFDFKELDSISEHHLRLGYEGSMIKDPHGTYVCDRSTNWLKYKPVVEGDFEVLDYYEGSGKNAGKLGGFKIKVSDSIVCNVGGGFSDAQRVEFYKNPPVGKLIMVEYKEKTADGLLREPVFVRVREDK